MLSSITDSIDHLEEDYENNYEESEDLPESLNIPGAVVSTQSQPTNNEETTNTYHDDDGFQSWWSQQNQMKENIREVCEKYGKSLNGRVPLSQFMYDSKHKLLFCRNAKVDIKKILIFIRIFYLTSSTLSKVKSS